MTEKQMQAAIDKIAALSVEVDKAAKTRWGKQAFVFAEAEGGLSIMNGDADPDRGTSFDRQKHIVMEAKGNHGLAVGRW